MFMMTVINFLLSSLGNVVELTRFIGLIFVILDLPKPRPRDDLFWNIRLNRISFWTQYPPASSNLFLPDSVPNNAW